MWNCAPILLLLTLLAVLTSTKMANLSSAIATFSAKFVNELDKNKSSVASPLSCEVLLALLTLGSSDPSHSELLAALDIPDDDAIRSSFTKLSSNLKAVQGVTLNIANKIYLKEGDYTLNSDLENDAVKVFDAAIEKMNFSDGAAAANTINKWVEDKTNNRIKDLLQPGDLNDFTRLVLVNALYFKGTWKHQFKTTATRDLPFHVNKERTIDVAMMHQVENFRYGVSEELGAKLLEMPYIGDQASMLVVLPNEIEGLNSVLDKLAAGHDLMQDLGKMWSTKVDVTIPKFKIETEIDLNTLLPKLGIKSIFDTQNSGLDRILANPEQLYVSKAVQKAFIEVNEEGAEAAAATGYGLRPCCGVIPRRFKVDRSFIIAILVNGMHCFLAAGRGDDGSFRRIGRKRTLEEQEIEKQREEMDKFFKDASKRKA